MYGRKRNLIEVRDYLSDKGDVMIQKNCKKKKIYIVVSQTGTILSRIIKVVTGDAYNHASISMDCNMRKMYSFGRKHPYNPIWGGLVMESPRFGTFKRFSGTQAVILCLTVDEEQYEQIEEYLKWMYNNRANYHYNYIGLFLALFHKPYKHKNWYYCSEFVREILARFNVASEEMFEEIIKPVHFLNLPEANVVYRGRLADYAAY